MRRLDKKALLAWEIYLCLAALLLTCLTLALYLVPFPFEMPIWIPRIFLVVWVAVCLFFGCVYLPLAYRRRSYGVVDGRLVVKGGAIYYSQKTMPLQSVKYVTTIRGPMEYLLNLTMLAVFSAGSFLVITGIRADEGEALKERLLSGK